MENKHFFIEVSTLFDKNFTGVSRVCISICKWFLVESSYDVSFFVDGYVVDKKHVVRAMQDNSGEDFFEAMKYTPEDFFLESLDKYIEKKRLSRKTFIGIYPMVKNIDRKFFDTEFLIMHDLTTVLIPEYHHPGNLEYVAKKLKRNVDSVDYVVCVSKSTAKDVVDYLEVDKSKVIVSYLGADHLEKDSRGVVDEAILNLKNEKFVYVLATIEPRKNINIVFDYISKYWEQIDYKFIFSGMFGWGESFNKIIKKNVSDNSQKVIERCEYLGFVKDCERDFLLGEAEYILYPSFYEGFGLPIIEGLAKGTSVVSSFSSSMPEVGGDIVEYFDPFSIESLHNAITRTLNSNTQPQKLKNRAANFTWEKFCTNAFMGEV